MSGYQKIIRHLLGVTAKVKPRAINIKFEAAKIIQVLPNVQNDAQGSVASYRPKAPPDQASQAPPKDKIN